MEEEVNSCVSDRRGRFIDPSIEKLISHNFKQTALKSNATAPLNIVAVDPMGFPAVYATTCQHHQHLQNYVTDYRFRIHRRFRIGSPERWQQAACFLKCMNFNPITVWRRVPSQRNNLLLLVNWRQLSWILTWDRRSKFESLNEMTLRGSGA